MLMLPAAGKGRQHPPGTHRTHAHMLAPSVGALTEAMTPLCTHPSAAEGRQRAEGKQQPTCMGMTLKSWISCSVSNAASCG